MGKIIIKKYQFKNPKMENVNNNGGSQKEKQ